MNYCYRCLIAAPPGSLYKVEAATVVGGTALCLNHAQDHAEAPASEPPPDREGIEFEYVMPVLESILKLFARKS